MIPFRTIFLWLLYEENYKKNLLAGEKSLFAIVTERMSVSY